MAWIVTMSEAFDPYYRWLGIPPKDQPPNHYRLLSIERFEPQADVIAEAADRQMAHLRTRQSGAHAAQAARLLNEIAAARVCLLSPAKRAEYDAQLAAALQPMPQAVNRRRLPMIGAAVVFCLLGGWLLFAVLRPTGEVASERVVHRVQKDRDVAPTGDDPSSVPSPLRPKPVGDESTSLPRKTAIRDVSRPSSALPTGIAKKQNPPSSALPEVPSKPATSQPNDSQTQSKVSIPSTGEIAAKITKPAATNPSAGQPATGELPGVATQFSPADEGSLVASNVPSPSKPLLPEVETAESNKSPAPGGYSLAAGKELSRFVVGQEPLVSFAMSADGQRLATSNARNQLAVIDLQQGTEIQTLAGADLQVAHVALMPDGKFLMAAGVVADSNLAQYRTYRVAAGVELTAIPSAQGRVTSLSLSPNGVYFALGHSQGTVTLHATQATVLPVKLYARKREGDVTALLFSIDSQHLIFADSVGKLHVAFIGSRKANLLQSLAAHRSSIHSLGVSASGDVLLSAAEDGTIALWQDWQGRGDAKAALKLETKERKSRCAALSPSAQWIATASAQGEITLWNASSGQAVASLAGHTAAVVGLEFLPNGNLASASRDGTVRIWDCSSL